MCLRPSVSNRIIRGFSFHQASTHADGSGNWNTYISCDVCGSGTSPPQNSGPLGFVLSASSRIPAPASFVTNNNSYLFAIGAVTRKRKASKAL